MKHESQEDFLSFRLNRPVQNMRLLLSANTQVMSTAAQTSSHAYHTAGHISTPSKPGWREKIAQHAWMNFAALGMLLLGVASLFYLFASVATHIPSNEVEQPLELAVFTDELLDLTSIQPLVSQGSWLSAVLAVLDETKASQHVSIENLDSRTALHFDSRVLFNAGSGDLARSGKALLDSLLPILKRLPSGIAIESHTVDRPLLFGAITSAQSLSNIRAMAVKQHLISKGLDEAGLSAMGYGASRGLVENNTAEQRDKNRRISLLLETK